LLLLSLAVTLHLWVVQAPQPQEPVYSVLASRVISSILIAPPLPLAPPLQLLSTRRPAGRVTLQTTIMNVPALPGPPLPIRSASFERTAVPVGTIGTMARAAVIDARPKLASFVAVGTLARLTSAPEPEPDSTPASSTVTAPSPSEPRSETAPLAAERSAPAAERLVAATTGRLDAAPASAFDEQRRQTVVAVVHQYARALERLDVSATKAVYPSVDGRELRRAFDGLKGQQYSIASCGVSFSTSGDDARARCTANATFRPKVGSRVLRLTDYEWVINLARGGGGWQIREAQILETRNQ
jgi:hypothetical protein